MLRKLVSKLNNWLTAKEQKAELEKQRIANERFAALLKDHFTVDRLVYAKYSDGSPKQLYSEQAEEELRFNNIDMFEGEAKTLREDLYGFFRALKDSDREENKEIAGVAAGWIEALDVKLRDARNKSAGTATPEQGRLSMKLQNSLNEKRPKKSWASTSKTYKCHGDPTLDSFHMTLEDTFEKVVNPESESPAENADRDLAILRSLIDKEIKKEQSISAAKQAAKESSLQKMIDTIESLPPDPPRRLLKMPPGKKEPPLPLPTIIEAKPAKKTKAKGKKVAAKKGPKLKAVGKAEKNH